MRYGVSGSEYYGASGIISTQILALLRIIIQLDNHHLNIKTVVILSRTCAHSLRVISVAFLDHNKLYRLIYLYWYCTNSPYQSSLSLSSPTFFQSSLSNKASSSTALTIACRSSSVSISRRNHDFRHSKISMVSVLWSLQHKSFHILYLYPVPSLQARNERWYEVRILNALSHAARVP